ncbi:inorganic polyphosphate/ATP-NAD kinase family protein [Gardnerella vaginalis]|uniref:NAD kinase n=2 Tax=Bifidobacteriaceae TaxID=31953 RepID=A0A135Z8B1_GARVA|nr:inorganic polyphosphate/ATP-NAD kinase family protein [Gardnerella vaginalis]
MNSVMGGCAMPEQFIGDVASGSRRALVVTHARLDKHSAVVMQVTRRLVDAGFNVDVFNSASLSDFAQKPCCIVDENTEIVVVLGGDGTMLQAAELVHCTPVPIIGINLGHVGFLAEFESFQIDEAIHRIAKKDYFLEHRMEAHVDVWLPGESEPLCDWALNDITLDRSDRGRMVELSIRVDDVEMSSFGCDGVIVSTPTGSTAYAFSAGGPIMWPNVEALQLVPLAAHALFARPLVIGSGSTFTIDILDNSSSGGWICCDGRRQRALPKGSRIQIRQSKDELFLARLSGVSFTQRLVTKFDLPVVGWRENRGIACSKN